MTTPIDTTGLDEGGRWATYVRDDGIVVYINLCPYGPITILPNGCWEWLGGRTNGYPSIHRNTYVHRLVANAQPSEVALHKCDFPLCVNPEHIVRATQRDNIMDARRKGRLITTGRKPGRIKTHCPRGHPYRIITRKKDNRPDQVCDTCRLDVQRRYRARKRGTCD